MCSEFRHGKRLIYHLALLWWVVALSYCVPREFERQPLIPPLGLSPDNGIKELDQVIVVLFTTHMFIGGFFGFILDNTIPGTDKERGIKSWRDKVQQEGRNFCDQSCYDIPFCNSVLKRFRCFQYLPFLPSYKTTQQGTS